MFIPKSLIGFLFFIHTQLICRKWLAVLLLVVSCVVVSWMLWSVYVDMSIEQARVGFLVAPLGTVLQILDDLKVPFVIMSMTFFFFLGLVKSRS